MAATQSTKNATPTSKKITLKKLWGEIFIEHWCIIQLDWRLNKKLKEMLGVLRECSDV